MNRETQTPKHPHLGRLIPNALTLGNLLFGVAALGVALSGRPLWLAAAFVGMALICDLFDGRAARYFGADNAFGAQLDSLADLVSFGVAPALTLYAWKLDAAGPLGLLAVGALVAAAGLRLAKFTAAAAQPKAKAEGPARFSGLAVTIPAAISLGAVAADLAISPRLAAFAGIGLAALMVSHFGYRSFKDRSVAFIAVPALILAAVGVAISHQLVVGLGLATVWGGVAYALSAPMSRAWRHMMADI
jgi:CDP-diacylglycerol--serine O-phosphatidyltransferase